jgi:predicted transcriptional regulator
MISLIHHDTSAAARPTHEDAELLREQCLNLLQANDYTADEIADMLRKSILSVRPRVSELNSRGLIWDSGRRRKNQSGNSAIVWTTREQTNLL